MKILLIANGNRKALGQNFYTIDARIHNGLVRNGHNVLLYSDRDEVRAKQCFGFRSIAAKALNREILQIVRHFKPDAIVMGHARLITNETLAAAREIQPELRIGLYSVDALFAPHNIDYLKERQGHIDCGFITSGGDAIGTYATKTQPYYFIPNITDTSIDTGRAFEKSRSELTYDLSFFANNGNSYDDQKRSDTALHVEKNANGLRTCYRGFDNRSKITGTDYVDALSDSAMGLNMSRSVIDGLQSSSETRHLYSSDRIAMIMGNGSLAFVQNDFGLQSLYSDKDVVFFSDKNDLAEKIKFYLADDQARQTIARNGWKKTHQDFNETMVTRYMIERLFGKELSLGYAWPITGFYNNA